MQVRVGQEPKKWKQLMAVPGIIVGVEGALFSSFLCVTSENMCLKGVHLSWNCNCDLH